MKNVTFGLGPAPSNLATRTLTITRMHRAGDDSAPAAQHSADAGVVENVTVALPSNTIWQAKLVDVLNSGETSTTDVLNFHTGELQFPGPSSGDRLSVLSMEDLSSSSSQSSSSQSSSSQSSVSSTSSFSVSSSSSSSSQSTSSSSQSSSSSPSSSSPSSFSSTSSSLSSSSQSSSSASSNSSSQS